MSDEYYDFLHFHYGTTTYTSYICIYSLKDILHYKLLMSNPSQPENSSNPRNPSPNSCGLCTLCATSPSVFNKSSILCPPKSGNPVIVFPSGGPNGRGCCRVRVPSRDGLIGLIGVNPFSRTISTHVLLSSKRLRAPSNNSLPREKIRSCHFNLSHNFFNASRSADVNDTAWSSVMKVPSKTRLFREAICQLDETLDLPLYQNPSRCSGRI